MASAKAKAQQLIDNNPVVVFSKTFCQYSSATKRTLDSHGAKYTVVEIDREEDGADLQNALQQISGQRTVPNIFISKQHIGGNSDLQARENKDLDELLRQAGAL